MVGHDGNDSTLSQATLRDRPSLLDALRDAPSTTDRLAGSNGTTNANSESNSESSVVSRDFYTYGDVECTYDRQPGVTSEGEIVDDYGLCAGGPDEAADRTVNVHHEENLPRQMGAACVAGAIAGTTAPPFGVPVFCALGAAEAIAADLAVAATTTATTPQSPAQTTTRSHLCERFRSRCRAFAGGYRQCLRGDKYLDVRR